MDWDTFFAAAIPFIVAVTAWIRAETANKNYRKFLCKIASTCPNRVFIDDDDLGSTTD